MTTHKSISSQERVTIVMVPYEQYSSFPRAIDSIYQHTDYPFELIVVEGNAPNSVKTAIERRTQYRKNAKIIYTNHSPLAGEARNLARPHIRTSRVFFMDNDVRVTACWLSNMGKLSDANNASMVCPAISNTSEPADTLSIDN